MSRNGLDRYDRDYTYRTLHEEEKWNVRWYSALWRALRPALVICAALVRALGLLTGVWRHVYDRYAAPTADTGETVAFEVASGQSLSRVANNLEKAGLIRSSSVFKYYCDFAGMGQKIQIGSYTLRPGMTIQEIADRLTTGDGNPIVTTITLIPGWTVEDFAAYLAQRGIVRDTASFLALCRGGEAFADYTYIADVLASADRSQRRYALEGYLAPNTYEIYLTASGEDILRRLLSQTDRVFPAEAQDRAEELGYDMDGILTIASMVEKEAKTKDFAKVAAVFYNRLRKGMALGSDVTIHYAAGISRMALTDADLAVNSPYNTYTHKGLPPGPICNPSQEAIEAALYPDEAFLADGYLYFCAKEPDSGELYFSRSQQEHEAAVAVYRPLWQAWDAAREESGQK